MANRTIYTFQQFVDTITTKLGNLGSTLTDFTEGSNILSIIKSFSHFIEFLQLQINIAMEAFTLKGAEGEDLTNRVQDFGITRRDAVAAEGIITFNRTSPATESFVIPEGTQVSTQPDVFGNTIDFTLDNDTTFPSGATSTTGAITCIAEGIIGNVDAGDITNITSTISGVDSITNAAALTNGAEEETDEELRQRVPEFLNGLKKANESAIKAAVSAVAGITFVRADENVPQRGEVTIYITNQSGVLSSGQIEEVLDAAEEAAAFGIQVNVVTPTVTNVTIELDVTVDTENYIQEVVEANIRTAIDEVVSINPSDDLRVVDIILAVMDVPGVSNCKNVLINGASEDYEVENFGVVRIEDKDTSITINVTSL